MRGSRTRSGARRRTPGSGPESDREANKRAARRCTMTRRATRSTPSRCPGDKNADELRRAKRFSPLTTVHRVGTCPGANAGPDRRRERPQERGARQRRCLVLRIAEGIETVLSLRTTRSGLFARRGAVGGAPRRIHSPRLRHRTRRRTRSGSRWSPSRGAASGALRASWCRGARDRIPVQRLQRRAPPARGPDGMARLVAGAIAQFEDPKRRAWAQSGGGRRDRWRSSRP